MAFFFSQKCELFHANIDRFHRYFLAIKSMYKYFTKTKTKTFIAWMYSNFVAYFWKQKKKSNLFDFDEKFKILSLKEKKISFARFGLALTESKQWTPLLSCKWRLHSCTLYIYIHISPFLFILLNYICSKFSLKNMIIIKKLYTKYWQIDT